MSIPDVTRDSIITADGHKYTGDLRTFPGLAGLAFDGKGEIHYTNGDHYTGDFVRNQRCGSGTLTYADGAVYEGEWVGDVRHGYGSLRQADGTVYDGAFRDDRRHGMGTEELPSGERYTGRFENNRRCGRGILDIPDGTVYEGSFRDSAQQGHGSIRFANGDVFQGEFVQGAMHGPGVYTFANGDVYEGEYRDGVRVGGIIRKKDGPTFNATFSATGEVVGLADKGGGSEISFKHRIDAETGEIVVTQAEEPQAQWKNGYGCITFADGSTYTGSFEDNKPHGEGVRTWPNGDRYEGWWDAGQRQGHGKMVWMKVQQFPHFTGWRYVGNFANDVFDGHGEMRYDTDGGFYSGFWQGGQREGLGKEVVGATTYQGRFVADVRQGSGVLTLGDGTTIEGTFTAGSCSDDDGLISYPDGGKYRGGVRGTHRHGEGHMECGDGSVYDGEFFDDQRHGVGVETLADGRTFQGRFVHDQWGGRGTLELPGGDVIEAHFAAGVPHGEGTLRKASGEVSRVVYKDGAVAFSQLIQDPSSGPPTC